LDSTRINAGDVEREDGFNSASDAGLVFVQKKKSGGWEFNFFALTWCASMNITICNDSLMWCTSMNEYHDHLGE